MEKRKEYIHTVTRLGTISIPVPIRRKYGITKGSKLKFIDTEEGIKLVPMITIQNMFGIDKENKELIKVLLENIIEKG